MKEFLLLNFVVVLSFHSVVLAQQTGAQQTDPILVRSHGAAIKPTEKIDQTFESVVGLDIVPRNRLRVIRRNPKETVDRIDLSDETIQAAKAAGLVAKNLQKSPRIDYDDLEPVSFSVQFHSATECSIEGT